jgi:tetratricopeptide (TPR) repeat protein
MGEVRVEAVSRGPNSSVKPLQRWWKSWLPSLFLIIASLAVYFPVHSYAFINLDDGIYVYQNPHVLGPLDWSTVAWAFTHTIGLNYSPLTLLSHNLDVRMFGLQAGWHHEVNVFLHALDAVLLFLLLKRATGFTGRSFMVAALFAFHPVQVENVAWVSERKTMLSALFFFLALGAYYWYARQPRGRRMAVVALLFGLGVLAKPQVIILPFVLLLWDYWPLRRMSSTTPDTSTNVGEVLPAKRFPALLTEKIPLFFIAGVDALLTMRAQHAAGDQPFTLSIRLGNAVLSYARYLGMAFWPPHLALLYLHPGYALSWAKVWEAALLLIGVSAFVIIERSHRYLLVGWLWFLGTLVPMIGVVQVDEQALADRYAYLSFIGLFLMVCWGMTEWLGKSRSSRLLLPAISIAALLAIAIMTYRQVGYWRDSDAVWAHTLEVTHRNWVAEINLAAFSQQRGDSQQALAHWYRAAEDKPTNSDINLSIALVEQARGNLQQAIRYYQKVLAVSRTASVNTQALENMGHAYSSLGDGARARECYVEAARYRELPPPQPPSRSVVNWDGDWRHLGSFLRERFQYLLSSQ